MTIYKRSTTAFCLVLSFAILCGAQEQEQRRPAPAVEVTAGGDRTQFSARGEIQQMRVEVFSPSGEKVYDSGAVFGQGVEWDMRGKGGRRLPEGVYLASVSTTDVTGTVHKRTEQVIVGNTAQGATVTAAPDGPTAMTTGSGTAGKIAKFTAATVLGDSIITENTGRIGINIAPPTARLHVNSATPAPVATNGTPAIPLLQTSGGQGGNTTASGKIGGKGASISLLAGNGGNAPSGSYNGNGGNITLQPGSPGAGAGSDGSAGTVFIAPTEGNVLIGTDGYSSAKVGITADASYSFGGQSLSSVLKVDNTCLGGIPGCSSAIRADNKNGTAIWASSGSSWGIRAESESSSGVFAVSTSSNGVHGRSTSSNGVLGQSTSDSGVFGDSDSGEGVFGRSTSGPGTFGLSNSGNGVHGKSTGKYGVFGESTNSDGVRGKSSKNGVYGEATSSGTGVSGVGGTGKGVYGQSTSNSGVFGFSGSGDGVTGQSGSGYPGNFLGKSRFTGNMEIGGNELFGATARQMINLYNTDYGIGIQSSTLYFRVANTAGYNWYMGGVHNNTQNSPGTGGTSLMRLDSAGNLYTKGSVNPASDRNAKSNFSSVNPRFILDKLASIPIQTWSYKADSDSVRHIGPVAQDFRAAFELGADDKHISTVDADGVTMAAVQGLYQMMLEKEKASALKDKRIEQLSRKLEALENQLQEVRRDVRRQRTSRRRSR